MFFSPLIQPAWAQTNDTKEEYNASEPVNDRKRWLVSSCI